MQRIEDQSPNRSRMRFWPFGVVALILISLVLFLLANVYLMSRHRRASARMATAIYKLSVSRPPELTDAQWAYCIAWTLRLNENYGSYPYVSTHDLGRIAEGLEERIGRGPDLTTIDWVWDQYIEAYPPASTYERFRPTSPQNRAEFQGGGNGVYPLSWFRSQYQQTVAQQKGTR